MQKNKTKMMTVSRMMLGLSTILSIFPKFSGLWPNGGSITVCCMLPIILVGYIFGVKQGLLTGLAFGILQILLGLKGIAGMDLLSTLGVIFFDYIVAFTVLGFGGVFKGKFKNTGAELAAGSVFAIFLRLVAHFISGYLLFSSYAEWFFTQEGFTLGNSIFASLGNGTRLFMLYSLMYNASYLLPEMLITGVVAFILGKSGVIERLER